MDLLQHLTDDQWAWLGCAGGLVLGMVMLSISYHSNPANRAPVVPQAAEPPVDQSVRRAA